MIPAPVCLDIKCRVHIIHILLVQLFTQQLHRFAEALEVYNFPFTEELDHIVHIRIVTEPQDIVIGHPCLLLWERIP